MYHVYREKNHSEFSRALMGEFTDLDEARACAKKSIAGRDEYNYIIEETDGHVNNYGDLITTLVEESD